MFRVLLPSIVACLLTACSLGSASNFSFGSGDSGLTTQAASAAGSRARDSSLGLGGEPATLRSTEKARVQTASLDKAPSGSYEKAPHGALDDRDYSSTALNAEHARDLINAYRKQHKLKPVTLNAELTAAAKAHSKDLAKWDRISHFGSDGSNPWDRVKRAGYNARVTAENVGTGQASFDEVLKGWEESPGHNKNLLMSDVENMGIALVQDPKTEFKTFWTLVLGARM